MPTIVRSLVGLRAASTCAAVFAFALVVWGAIVRINGAGMTCPDWPRCRGAWFPNLTGSVFYEWEHRLGATILTLLIGITFAFAYAGRRELQESMRFAWISLGMLVAQVVVGALTIRYANSPASVAAHLVIGVGTFISLLLLAYGAWSRLGRLGVTHAKGPVPRSLSWLALATTVVAFLAVIAGGFMSASHAGLACTAFPLCNGWSGTTTAAGHIHMAHRYAAYATFVLVLALAGSTLAARNVPREFTRLVIGSLLLVVAQVALGVATVLSGLTPLLRSVHEANGVLLVAALSLATYRSQLVRSQAPQPIETLKAYVGLTKPNVMSLLLFTTLAAMMMAAAGFPPLALVCLTMLGGALASASSASINMYLDKDLDAQMSRTRLRPIPSGRVPARNALVFGLILGVLACVELWIGVNPLAALLAGAGILYYVIIYTLWLKRVTPQNIVIGGAAGSIPPLVGWAAVTHHLGLTAYLLFLIVFVWTPPHFWSLALMKKDEYARVGLPMLPAVRGEAVTKRQIVGYSIVLVALTLVMVPLHLMGTGYLAAAIVLDAALLAGAVWVATSSSKKSQGLMYRFSMLYLALLFSAMVIDRIARGGA